MPWPPRQETGCQGLSWSPADEDSRQCSQGVLTDHSPGLGSALCSPWAPPALTHGPWVPASLPCFPGLGGPQDGVAGSL